MLDVSLEYFTMFSHHTAQFFVHINLLNMEYKYM